MTTATAHVTPFLDAQKHALELVVKGVPLPDVLAFLTSVVERVSQQSVVASILLLDDDGRLRVRPRRCRSTTFRRSTGSKPSLRSAPAAPPVTIPGPSTAVMDSGIAAGIRSRIRQAASTPMSTVITPR